MAGQRSTSVDSQTLRPNNENFISVLASMESSTPGQAEDRIYTSHSHRENSVDDIASQHPPQMGYSVFGDSTDMRQVYQEQVAWANYTHFGTSLPAAAKPQMVQTTYLRTTDSTPSPPHDYFRLPRHMLEPWITGFWLRLPWRGFGAAFLVLLLTGASASILFASHDTSPEIWRHHAQPRIYLSVFEMAMNLLVLFALAEGVVIRFWRQLLHGTTLDAIYDNYESTHLWSAIKRTFRFRFNAIAVACILASSSFARGPLFQRALTVTEHGRRNIAGLLELKIAPLPVHQFFNSSQSFPHGQMGITPLFLNVIEGLVTGQSLPYERPDLCGDHCTGSVKSYNFRVSCESQVRNMKLDTDMRGCESCMTAQCKSDCQSRREIGINTTFFSIGAEQVDGEMILRSVHKNTTSCNGDVHIQKCTLTEANGDVPFVLVNGTIDRQPGIPISLFYDEKVSSDDIITSHYWPLAFNMFFPPVSFNVTASLNSSKLEYTRCLQPSLDYPAASTSAICSDSSFPPALFRNDPSVVYANTYETKTDEDPLCGLTWHDPMPDMIIKMQSLAFRTTVAMATAPEDLFLPNLTSSALTGQRPNWRQQVPIAGYRTLSLYHTSPLFVVLGIVTSVVGVLTILPLYYGFWELGRKVTLNPLEIARAFGSPIMDGLDGNTTAEMITVERGDMSVRYGALDRYGQQKRLRVQPTAECNVRTPWEGEIFG